MGRSEWGTAEKVLLSTLDYFREKLIEAEETIDILQGQINHVNEENAWLIKERDEAFVNSATLDELKQEEQKYSELHQKYIETSRNNDLLKASIEVLQKEINDKEVERRELITDLDEIKERYSNLEKSYKELENDYLDCENDYNSLHANARKLQEKHDKLTNDWAIIYTEKQAAERLANEMEINYQTLLKEYDELYEQNEKLKAELKLIDENSKDMDAYINSWEKAGI